MYNSVNLVKKMVEIQTLINIANGWNSAFTLKSDLISEFWTSRCSAAGPMLLVLISLALPILLHSYTIEIL